MKLVKYDEVDAPEYLAYSLEWEADGGTIVPGSADRGGRSFEEILGFWAEDESEGRYAVGKVPSTQFFLIDGAGRILGAIAFRHTLNAKLLEHGGHIGYGVRPCERRKGYGGLMLSLLLEKVQARGCDRVLLTCDDDNAGSCRIIEKNGGILEKKIVFEGKPSRRYWIDLGK
jgi:predicted acetyltransferase